MFTERRKRSHSIGLTEGDSMPKESILAQMKPVVLAKNDPAIIGSSHIRTSVWLRMDGLKLSA